MAIDLVPDLGEEIIRNLIETNEGITRTRKAILEKDKKILELELQIKELKNGS